MAENNIDPAIYELTQAWEFLVVTPADTVETIQLHGDALAQVLANDPQRLPFVNPSIDLAVRYANIRNVISPRRRELAEALWNQRNSAQHDINDFEVGGSPLDIEPEAINLNTDNDHMDPVHEDLAAQHSQHLEAARRHEAIAIDAENWAKRAERDAANPALRAEFNANMLDAHTHRARHFGALADMHGSLAEAHHIVYRLAQHQGDTNSTIIASQNHTEAQVAQREALTQQSVHENLRRTLFDSIARANAAHPGQTGPSATDPAEAARRDREIEIESARNAREAAAVAAKQKEERSARRWDRFRYVMLSTTALGMATGGVFASALAQSYGFGPTMISLFGIAATTTTGWVAGKIWEASAPSSGATGGQTRFVKLGTTASFFGTLLVGGYAILTVALPELKKSVPWFQSGSTSLGRIDMQNNFIQSIPQRLKDLANSDTLPKTDLGTAQTTCSSYLNDDKTNRWEDIPGGTKFKIVDQKDTSNGRMYHVIEGDEKAPTRSGWVQSSKCMTITPK